MGMGLVGMLAFGTTMVKRDDKRRAAKHANFFDGLIKVIKKRDGGKAKKKDDEGDEREKEKEKKVYFRLFHYIFDEFR